MAAHQTARHLKNQTAQRSSVKGCGLQKIAHTRPRHQGTRHNTPPDNKSIKGHSSTTGHEHQATRRNAPRQGTTAGKITQPRTMRHKEETPTAQQGEAENLKGHACTPLQRLHGTPHNKTPKATAARAGAHHTLHHTAHCRTPRCTASRRNTTQMQSSKEQSQGGRRQQGAQTQHNNTRAQRQPHNIRSNTRGGEGGGAQAESRTSEPKDDSNTGDRAAARHKARQRQHTPASQQQHTHSTTTTPRGHTAAEAASPKGEQRSKESPQSPHPLNKEKTNPPQKKKKKKTQQRKAPGGEGNRGVGKEGG